MPSIVQSPRRPSPASREKSSAPRVHATARPAHFRIPYSTTYPQSRLSRLLPPATATEAGLILPPKPPWSAAEKQAQDKAIHGIFRALYRSTSGLHPQHHIPDDARSFVRLAQQALAAAALPHARFQESHLIHWAHQNNLLIQRKHLPAAFQPHDLLEGDQMEHHVWPDATGQRILKLTHAGHFGLWPVTIGDNWDMCTQAATPARYLSRIHAANTHLADDWILHAIVTDQHHDHIQLLTSQPAYPGITPGDIIDAAPESHQAQLRSQQQRLITQALAIQGFHPTTSSPSTFYRPSDNLAMLDAHLHNLMWLPTPQSHKLMPFDVILLHPHGSLRQNITRSQSPSPTQPTLLQPRVKYHKIPLISTP